MITHEQNVTEAAWVCTIEKNAQIALNDYLLTAGPCPRHIVERTLNVLNNVIDDVQILGETEGKSQLVGECMRLVGIIRKAYVDIDMRSGAAKPLSPAGGPPGGPTALPGAAPLAWARVRRSERRGGALCAPGDVLAGGWHGEA